MVEQGTPMVRRRFVQGAMLAGLTATVAACTSENSSGNASSDGIQGPRKELAKTDGMTAGVVLETLSHPLINYWGQTAKEVAESFGIKATLQDGERNVEKQTSEMEALISQKVNFIVLQATDAAGLSAVVEKAEKAGIPVLTLNQDVATPHSCFVGMGHFAMGQQVAKGMADQLGGQGSIVLVEGVQGTGANIQRVAGFKDTLKSYPNMKIIASQSGAFDRKKGHDVMATILRGQSKIDGVFALNDEMAIGAAQAAVEAGRLTPGKLEMKIWGADGERDMFTSIQKGECAGVSAVDERVIPQTLVFVAAWMMTAGLKGNQAAGAITIPPFNVTKDNIAELPLPAA